MYDKQFRSVTLFNQFLKIPQLLQNKFDDLKHRVEAGADRFNQCEALAKKLISNESPHTAVIEKRQEQLR